MTSERMLLWNTLVIATIACAPSNSSSAENRSVEEKFLAAGLVDVQSIDPTITVDLVNSDASKNVFGKDFYQGLKTAYLRRSVAEKLSKAQKNLKQKHPGYSLQIMDAARPRSVSVAMYNAMKGTRFEKYVANPKRGSMHNFGAAVDIAIMDEKGALLDMGFIPFYKSKVAAAHSFARSQGGLTGAQKANRTLLKEVMLAAGFRPLAHEWWHFNGFSKSAIREKFEMIE